MLKQKSINKSDTKLSFLNLVLLIIIKDKTLY